MTTRDLSQKQLNFARVSIVCVDIVKLPLKDILNIFIKPTELVNNIKACQSLLDGEFKLNPDQRRKCSLNSTNLPDYSNFDVTLLYKLIRHLCPDPSLGPTNKWGKKPKQNDVCVVDDIERIRELRNTSFAHTESAEISDDDFKKFWRDAKCMMNRCQQFTTSNGCKNDYNQLLIDLDRKTFTFEEYMSQKERSKAIYISGDTQVLCGEKTCFKAEITLGQDVYLPVNWEKLDKSFRKELDISSDKYKGSNSRELFIHCVCKEDEGRYQAVISRNQDVKIYSNEIYLCAQGEPPCLEELTVTSINDEIDIHYVVKVSKASPVVTQIIWTKNNLMLDLSNDKYCGGGLADSFLRISRAGEEDKGEYTCTVLNAVGLVSKTVKLGIPSAEIRPTSNVIFDSDTRLDCSVSGNPNPYKVEWQKSDDGTIFSPIDIDSDRYFGGSTDPGFPCLLLRKATFSDQQYYQVAVWNVIGKNTSNPVLLKVTGSRPNISEGTCTVLDRSVRLRFNVFLYDESPPVIDVYWTKNREKLDTSIRNGKYSEKNNDGKSLIIKKVTESDAGRYQLAAANAVGDTKSEVIKLAVPEVLLDNFKRQEDGRWRFTMTINSVPTPHYVQWSIKNTSETFQPLNVNAEEYKGTSSLFPHPVLIIQHIERQKSCVFELEVKNRIGRATKQMQGEMLQEYIQGIEIPLGKFYSDGGSRIPFSKLLTTLAEKLPTEKIDRLKLLIQTSCEIENSTKLEEAKTPEQFLVCLVKENILTKSDVVAMQFALKQTNCEELEKKCVEYAQQWKAMHYFETPPEPGSRNVYFHVVANLQNFSPEDELKIKKTVAKIIGCSLEEIKVHGYLPSSSFLLVLSIKEIYIKRLLAMRQHDKDTLIKLNIDYLKDDFMTIRLIEKSEFTVHRPMIHHTKGILEPPIESCVIEKAKTKSELTGEIYSESDNPIEFIKLIYELDDRFPTEKISRLKYLIQVSCNVEDVTLLEEAKTVFECFMILGKEGIISPSDIIVLQFLLKETKCEKLERMCLEYAQQNKALCYYEEPPETGFQKLHFHVLGEINKYNKDDTTKIMKTVASIVGCSEKDISICGILPSSSFFVVLSIKEIWIKRLKSLNQHDNDKLSKLNIDYFKDDLGQTAGVKAKPISIFHRPKDIFEPSNKLCLVKKRKIQSH